MNLDQLRDELAEKYTEGHFQSDTRAHIFKAGWSALLKLLERSGGEFDRGVIENKWNEIGGTGNDSQDFMLRNNACWGAQLQFEADRARIGLAEQKYIDVVDRYSKAADRVVQAEARVVFRETQIRDHEETIEYVEARIKELEAERIAHLLLIDGQAKEIEK